MNHTLCQAVISCKCGLALLMPKSPTSLNFYWIYLYLWTLCLNHLIKCWRYSFHDMYILYTLRLECIGTINKINIHRGKVFSIYFLLLSLLLLCAHKYFMHASFPSFPYSRLSIHVIQRSCFHRYGFGETGERISHWLLFELEICDFLFILLFGEILTFFYSLLPCVPNERPNVTIVLALTQFRIQTKYTVVCNGCLRRSIFFHSNQNACLLLISPSPSHNANSL